jgi:hypothetical protein
MLRDDQWEVHPGTDMAWGTYRGDEQRKGDGLRGARHGSCILGSELAGCERVW